MTTTFDNAINDRLTNTNWNQNIAKHVFKKRKQRQQLLQWVSGISICLVASIVWISQPDTLTLDDYLTLQVNETFNAVLTDVTIHTPTNEQLEFIYSETSLDINWTN